MQAGHDIGGGFRDRIRKQETSRTEPGSPGDGARGHRARGATIAAGLIAVLTVLGVPLTAGLSAPAGASSAVAHAALSISLQWQQIVPDAGNPIAQSSPTAATLDGGGPSVVVGDRAGNVWAFHLSNGSTTPGWPAHTGAPIDSTPSAMANGSGTDNIFVDAGNASQPTVGGYYAFNNTGGQIWHVGAPDLNGQHGVQASPAVGVLNGVPAVVAPSLGQNQYALQRRQRGHVAGLAVLHGRQQLQYPVPGRPVRQRPDRDRGGRRLVAGPGLRRQLHRRVATCGCSEPAAT